MPLSAMQIIDARSAAVFIQKQRPLVQACLKQARRSTALAEIWSYSACEQLLTRDQQIKTAWALLLPQGSITGLIGVPYGLRQPTVDAYAEYKSLAERVAELSR